MRELTFVRVFQDWKLEELETFMQHLYQFKGSGEGEVSWSGKGKEGFLSRVFYFLICGAGAEVFPWKRVWKTVDPTRVAFFVWTAALDAILLKDTWGKRGIQVAELVLYL